MAIEDHIDTETMEERETVAKFLRQIAGEYKYDAVFLVGRNGDSVDAVWYGENLTIYSMACLGRKSIWNVITGNGSADSKKIDDENENEWV